MNPYERLEKALNEDISILSNLMLNHADDNPLLARIVANWPRVVRRNFYRRRVDGLHFGLAQLRTAIDEGNSAALQTAARIIDAECLAANHRATTGEEYVSFSAYAEGLQTVLERVVQTREMVGVRFSGY